MRKRLVKKNSSIADAAANKPVIILILALVFAVMGILLLLRSSAATGTQKLEAEKGTVSGKAAIALASGSGFSGEGYTSLNGGAIGGVLGLDSWTYSNADSSRQGPNYLWGLGLGDVTGDGYADIVAGQYLYINKGTGDITGTWQRQVAFNDGWAVGDVDGDATADVMDFLGELRWLEWNGSAMTVRASGSGPSAHQGMFIGELLGGGMPEVVYSTDNAVYMAVINGSSITATELASGMADEMVGIGDFNKDGKPDVVGSDGNNAVWLENNGSTSGWTKHIVGIADNGENGGGFTDKVAAADIDKDGNIDIVLCEEVFDGGPANTYWWKNPGTGAVASPWPQRTTIASQDTTNSMSVADMDNDGDIDVITGEHRGDKEAVVWANNGSGTQWTKHQISSGHENHGGTRVIDLDNDGDLDVVSIAYDAPQDLHIYRNDAR